MKKCFKKCECFTLAEIMIALTIIGIITAILLPVAQNSLPNERVMKFKKANATLARVINELVTSGEYYTPGDLGMKPDGTLVDGTHENDTQYFCNKISEIINTKKNYCNEIASEPTTYNNYLYDYYGYFNWDGDNYCKKTGDLIIDSLDSHCNWLYKDTNGGIEFENITIKEIHTGTPFGSLTDENNNKGIGGTRLFFKKKCDNNASLYKVMCIDIGSMGKSNDLFGYGIRVDGKMILGARAQEWLEKDIQDKE